MEREASRALIPAAPLAAVAAILMFGPAGAADCLHPAMIHFDRGRDQAVVKGGIVRSDEVCYVFDARAGQTLHADVSSPDRNVVFSLYRPGYGVEPANDGPDVTGATVAGAGAEDDATSVEAALPASGRYLFLLGTSRGGGGEYALHVRIR